MLDLPTPSANSQHRFSSPVSAQHPLTGSTQLSKSTVHWLSGPLSPPLSATASHFDASAGSSPQSAVFTPSSTQPMSAQTSLQGHTPSYSQKTSSKGPQESRGYRHSLDGDGDAIMSEGGVLDVEARTSSKHRLTDDDMDFEPSKRQRTDQERELKSDQPPDPIVGAQGPGESVASFYKLCHTPHLPSRPHPTDDLFSLYNLTDIAASVSRKDPVTGAKINKLRKSYEGKVKDLAGKNKAVTKPGELRGILDYPDEEWHIQQVMGKELIRRDANGDEIDFDPAQALLAKLGSAVNMLPEKLPGPEHEKWENFLDQESALTQPAPSMERARPVASAPPTPANGALSQPPRPKRQGTKRRYHDEVYEGYGDSFTDDMGDTVSLDGDDDATSNSGGKKRRRKDTVGSSHFPSPIAQYTPSTVSVGSGSYPGR